MEGIGVGVGVGVVDVDGVGKERKEKKKRKTVLLSDVLRFLDRRICDTSLSYPLMLHIIVRV